MGDINLRHDYMVGAPAMAAEIPLLCNRISHVRRDEVMTFPYLIVLLKTELTSQGFQWCTQEATILPMI